MDWGVPDRYEVPQGTFYISVKEIFLIQNQEIFPRYLL
jgi:hypothetical protein